MKSKVRFKGKLRSYLCWPLWLTIPMTLADVGLYFYDVTAGFLLTVFIAIYFVLELGLYYNTRPRLANEIINFATQYATVQKKLLNEFEIPYALLDYTGKILWVNERFLSTAEYKDGLLHCGLTTFKSLYVDVNYMEFGALQSILCLAKQGLPVILKRLPVEPGRNKHSECIIKGNEIGM